MPRSRSKKFRLRLRLRMIHAKYFLRFYWAVRKKAVLYVLFLYVTSFRPLALFIWRFPLLEEKIILVFMFGTLVGMFVGLVLGDLGRLARLWEESTVRER